jgi:phosphatidylglycerol:prolipoprotein diacylglycerol transferase
MLDFFRILFAPPRDLILLLFSAWIGLSLAERRAPRHRVDPESLNNLIFAALLGYLLGGRLGYAAAHLSAFARDPWSLIALNLNLFDPLGALATSLIVALAYGQRIGLELWSALDALTPFLACLSVGLGFSHLASGEAFGKPTNLPWAIQLLGASRHPTQAYEILASLATLWIVLIRKPGSSPGISFVFFAALTAGWRLFLEAFRGDSVIVLGGLRSAQVIAWLFLAGSLIALEYLNNKRAAQES